jgi:hypothetical protein
MAKKTTVKVGLRIVPTGGEARMETVEVAATGASIEEICKVAGVDGKKLEFSLNGKPATLQTHVTQADLLEATDRGKAAVTASERPAGS